MKVLVEGVVRGEEKYLTPNGSTQTTSKTIAHIGVTRLEGPWGGFDDLRGGKNSVSHQFLEEGKKGRKCACRGSRKNFMTEKIFYSRLLAARELKDSPRGEWVGKRKRALEKKPL